MTLSAILTTITIIGGVLALAYVGTAAWSLIRGRRR